MSPRTRTITSTLLHRPERDQLLDALMPPELRHLSAVHWTPFDVALRAARLLAPRASMRVLDVGAGVGKLCLVGALSTGARWCGVEQHASLVGAATWAAEALGLADRARFVHGDALAIDWSGFDAVYLYNPFETLLVRPDDLQAERRRHAFDVQIAAIEARLASLAAGVRVVTFHGFGGEMPPGYDRVAQERAHTGQLDLWVRRAGPRRGVVGTS